MDNTLIKYDALSVEAMDKIHICLDLLVKHAYIEKEKTLKETYNKVLNIYKIDRTSQKMWEMVWKHKILSLFQMEKQSGIQGIELAKPKSVNDLSVLNSVIRLMPSDKNSETPLITWSKYRKNISLWIKEMQEYGLTEEEIKWLSDHSAVTDGLCESQEGLMSLVQEERLGGNSLAFADKCRKGIAKKQGQLFKECEEEFYNSIKEKKCSEKLARYVWEVLLKVQRGYSFNRSHCLAYSLVALQEMNLAYKFPTIIWNCACLISNSGSGGGNTDYAKIAKALTDVMSYNIKISLVDINKSEYEFEPYIENDTILYGLKALSHVGDKEIDLIKKNRPFKSFKDFMTRCPLTRPAMYSLIKAGAFDKLEESWAKELNVEPRILVMAYYITKACEPKTKLNLQNMNGLLEKNLIPNTFDFNKKVYSINKFLKTHMKKADYYEMNDSCINIFKDTLFAIEDYLIQAADGKFYIKQKAWEEKVYKPAMEKIKKWLKDNQQKVLFDFNKELFMEHWNKYAKGTISAWEMESLCFYYHDHELKNINRLKYGISNYFMMPKEPEVDYFFKKGNRSIPVYKIHKIIGTVISKNDNHATISLFTPEGLVNVKFTKEYYAMFKRQLSEKQEDGSKRRMEEGWFKRGTKLLICGYRKGENEFISKTYKKTGSHQMYKIEVENGTNLILTHSRWGQGE